MDLNHHRSRAGVQVAFLLTSNAFPILATRAVFVALHPHTPQDVRLLPSVSASRSAEPEPVTPVRSYAP